MADTALAPSSGVLQQVAFRDEYATSYVDGYSSELLLVQVHLLAPDVAAQTQAAVAIQVGFAGTLLVDSAAHAQQSSGVVMAVSLLLSVDGAAHQHAAPDLVLAAGALLAVDSALHDQVSGSPGLAQEQLLAVDVAVLQQQAGTLSLSGDAVLVVDGAALGHAATGVVVSTGAVLVVGVSSSAHIADRIDLPGETPGVLVTSREFLRADGPAERQVMFTGPTIDPGVPMRLDVRGVEYATWTLTSDEPMTVLPDIGVVRGGVLTWHQSEWADGNSTALTRTARLLFAGPEADSPGAAVVLPAGRTRTQVGLRDGLEYLVRGTNTITVG